MFREQGGVPVKTVAELRKELEAKRAANLKKEEAQRNEATDLEREIAIEDKRTEAYAAGLVEEQLVTINFPGIGLCLFRTPQDLVYRNWAKKSGALKGELTNDPVVHDELVSKCILYPAYAEFSAAARERCPRAPTQFVSAMIQRMEGKIQAEGK
jgi:hypothetical protein